METFAGFLARVGFADGSSRGKNLYDLPSARECRIAGAVSLRPVALLELWAASMKLEGDHLKAEVAECGGGKPQHDQHHAEAV